MCRKMIYLATFVLVLVAGPAWAVDPLYHWPFDNSGEDVMGDNDARLDGNAIFSTDAMEGSHSLELDGSTAWADCTLTPTRSVQPRTIAMWIKANNPTGGLQILYHASRSVRGHLIWIENGELHALSRESGDRSEITIPYTDTAWHHMVYVFSPAEDQGKAELYLDGELVGQENVTFSINGPMFFPIGLGSKGPEYTILDGGMHKQLNPAYFLDGNIDDVRIYDQPLTAQDIGLWCGTLRANPSRLMWQQMYPGRRS